MSTEIGNTAHLTNENGLYKLGHTGGNMKKQILAALALIAFIPILEALPEKHAITFDDFMRIKRVSDPQVSPGGQEENFHHLLHIR